MKMMIGTGELSDAETLDATIDEPVPGGPNVGTTERKISAAGGALLVLLGLRSRSLGGLLTAAAGGALLQRAITGHCGAYQALGINTLTPGAPPSANDYFVHSVHVEQSLTIAKPANELFQFWRNFANLPRFMSHLKSVHELDYGKSHWIAAAPAGRTVEWDAEIINEEPDKLIAWRSLGGADVDSAGSVRFLHAPENGGTIVKVVLDYIPPAGRVGAFIAKLLGEEPSQQIEEDLRRFKKLMETGE